MKYVTVLASSCAIACFFVISGALYSLMLPMPVRLQLNHAGRSDYSSTHDNLAQGQVTVLVLAMSGSIQKQAPDDLSCSAADAYIDLSSPGDLIGVIGPDNNKAGRVSAHNFPQAMDWLPPVPADTLVERQKVQQIIMKQSHNCRYDGTIPTYDALKKAFAMLTTSAKNGSISGSVIVLTDGEPFPAQSGQEAEIQSELLPGFKAHNWPIDSIALNTSTSALSFLSSLSNTTSGKVYSSANTVVPGVSPLNITPFLIDIFGRHHNRIAVPNFGPITLNSRGYARNFPVNDFTDELDIIIVKEWPETTVTLQAPGPDGHVYQPDITEVYFAIFLIKTPRAGDWQLNVTGQRRFLMNSLALSSVHLMQLLPDARTTVIPLGQPFFISVAITDQNTRLGSLAVSAAVSYVGVSKGIAQPRPQLIQLSDIADSGTYQGQMTVSPTYPPGSYEIIILARGDTGDIIGSSRQIVRLEVFPMPFFVNQHNQPTIGPLSYPIEELNPFLQRAMSVPPMSFGWWPLSNHFVPAPISLSCRIELRGKLYVQALVRVSVLTRDSNNPIKTTLLNDGDGHVQIILPPQTANGEYRIVFHTSGTFEDSHGDFGTIVRFIRLTGTEAAEDDFIVWLLLFANILFLAFIILLIRFSYARGPFGLCIEGRQGEIVPQPYYFKAAHRSRLRWFFWRHTLKSEKVHKIEPENSKPVSMPAGLEFRFRYRRAVEVRARGDEGVFWESREKQMLDSKQFRKINELGYYPEGKEQSRENTTYLIDEQKTALVAKVGESYDGQ